MLFVSYRNHKQGQCFSYRKYARVGWCVLVIIQGSSESKVSYLWKLVKPAQTALVRA